MDAIVFNDLISTRSSNLGKLIVFNKGSASSGGVVSPLALDGLHSQSSPPGNLCTPSID